jgi:DNA-binding MurR/RpiR family transcriptional regulator
MRKPRLRTSSRASGAAANGSAAPSAHLLALFQEHRLTPTQRRIAQSLVEHAADAAFLSSGEVAELANVSQPSVTRFAVALGFDGYPDLRRTIRTLTRGETGETVGEARRNELQQAVAAEIVNLQQLGETLADLPLVEKAALLLAPSRPLIVIGLRASAPLANYFGYFAAKVHPDTRVLSHAGTALGDQLEQARAAGGEAVLAFVLPRYPEEMLDALRYARRLGFSIVTITDRALAPAEPYSDVVLRAAVGSQLVFDSYAAPMVLAMALLQATCDAMPAQAQDRLEAFERSAAGRHIFVQ